MPNVHTANLKVGAGTPAKNSQNFRRRDRFAGSTGKLQKQFLKPSLAAGSLGGRPQNVLGFRSRLPGPSILQVIDKLESTVQSESPSRKKILQSPTELILAWQVKSTRFRNNVRSPAIGNSENLFVLPTRK